MTKEAKKTKKRPEKYQALYTKYRPMTFSDVSGQENVKKILANSIKNNRIGHAYIFSGPRGTGKTTLARIFAKATNCENNSKFNPPAGGQNSKFSVEPCNECKNCRAIIENKSLDFIEIDAASNTGVDNIRKLQETVNLPPSDLKYKIYIIDEVHMLSMGAFNALLKTLEEPPAYVIFILATTELHKVPQTILSRCQQFNISRLDKESAIKRLEKIAKGEKKEFEKGALEIIASQAEGSMRDAISIIDQVISLEDEKITAKEVSDILGIASRKIVFDFSKKLLTEKNAASSIELLEKIWQKGANLKVFHKDFIGHLRELLIIKTDPNLFEKMSLSLTKEQAEDIKKYLQPIPMRQIMQLMEIAQKNLEVIKSVDLPQLPLELTIIDFVSEFSDRTTEPTEIQNNTNPKTQKATEPTEMKMEIEKPMSHPSPIPQKTEKITTEENDSLASSTLTNNNLLTEITSAEIKQVFDHWGDILEATLPINRSIHAFLKNCAPLGGKNNTFYIKAPFAIYKDKLNETNNKLTVQTAIAKIVGSRIRIAFINKEEAAELDFSNSEEKNSDTDTNPLHDAMRVFGGKMVG